MSASQKFYRLLATALCSAVAAGIVFAMDIAVQEPDWSKAAGARGVATLAGVSALFAFLILVPLGAAIALIVPALLAKAGLRDALAYFTAGVVVGLAVYSIFCWVFGGPLISLQYLTGAVGGGVAGLTWWSLVQRFDQQAQNHG